MANLLKYAQWHRFGVNSTGTARTGTPSSYTTIPVLADGVNLAGSIETENLDTEHKDNGVRWSLLKNRNREKGTIRCPLFPENVFLLDMPLSLWLFPLATLSGVALSVGIGWLAVRQLLGTPPLLALRAGA
jgi:hypothetical protein